MKVLHRQPLSKKNKKADPADLNNPSKNRKAKGVLLPEKLALANKLLAGVTIPEGKTSKN